MVREGAGHEDSTVVILVGLMLWSLVKISGTVGVSFDARAKLSVYVRKSEVWILNNDTQLTASK
jgi:hypothetical protein